MYRDFLIWKRSEVVSYLKNVIYIIVIEEMC